MSATNACFTVEMRHTEDSLVKLAHMQYDLFCLRNYIARNLLGITVVLIGAYFFSQFWGILLMAYGIYLMTSTYSAADHNAKKTAAAIESSGLGFPSSRYYFEPGKLRILYHPGREDEEELEPLGYGQFLKLGEDREYFYLFASPNGGYMIPKAALGGQADAFRRFLQEKTGKPFFRSRSPLQRLRSWMKDRENAPEHL